MLDRFRDLIVLAAVPDAAQIGLLDLAPDRAERMAAQAGTFGQAGLTRAAEIISTGLDQMRGATSPRLLLELMCAQVLLPAAATDEKSLLARLERLERGTPAPIPSSSPRPPHSAPDHDAERSRVAPSRQPRAPEPSTRPAPAASPPPPAPAASAERPGPTVPPASPARSTSSAPSNSSAPSTSSAPPAEPAAATPGALSQADTLRQNWAAVLDAVKGERRVAWILLSNASVLSVEDGVLTLRFARDGDLKGFSTSGCDADLKRVLSSRFGLNVMVRGLVGGDAPAGPVPGFPGASGSGPAPRGRGPATGPPASAPPAVTEYDDEPPEDMPPDEDELPPDDPPSRRAPAAEPELTGMDLIQRELGGQVIGEIEG
jgi:DNA polymerase-3 subunit gamma/tau